MHFLRDLLRKPISRKALLCFALAFSLIDVRFACAQIVLDSYTGPITDNELASFKNFMLNRLIPPHPWGFNDTDHNYISDGPAGRDVEAMGLMYEATGNVDILNRMVDFVDAFVYMRNDLPGGTQTVMWTGDVDPVWPGNGPAHPPSNYAGGENGDTIAHIEYCALLILKTPSLWELPIPDGDPHGFGVTYLDRAKFYIARTDEANDQYSYKYFVTRDNLIRNPPNWPQGFHTMEAINIQMMLDGGFERDAEIHELLADNPDRVAKYDAVVQTSVRECLDGMEHAYTADGQTVYKWGYYPWSTNLNESVGHGNYDVLGIWRAWMRGSVYGITTDEVTPIAEAMVHVISQGNNQFTGNVDGSGSIMNRMDGEWVPAADWDPLVYDLIAQADVANGRYATTPGIAAPILWMKQRLSAPPIADFSLSVTSTAPSVTPGSIAGFTVTLKPSGNFADAVSLSVSGLPNGAIATFNPASISGGSGSATLTIATTSPTPANSYALTVTGTPANGSFSRTAQATLVIDPPPSQWILHGRHDKLLTGHSSRQRLLLDAGWRFQLHDPEDAGPDVTSYPEISNLAKLKAADVDAETQLEQTRPDVVATHVGESVSFVQSDFDDSSWRAVDLPHDWAVELPFSQTDDKGHGYKALKGNSIGWYRRSFHLPAHDSGKVLLLEFDGVYRNALVWLNGHILGRNVSGYSSFFFDITQYANFGGSNVLVVRVDATRLEGWFYEGAGIYRHVWLEQMDPVHVDHWGTFVTSDANVPDAQVNIQTDVRNDGSTDSAETLLSAILDARGNVVGSAAQPVSVGAGQVTTVNQRVTVANVNRWSPDTPYLYKVVSIIGSLHREKTRHRKHHHGEETTVIADRYETPFGVRSISFDPNNGFLLNGQRFDLRGVADHQDHAGIGSALPDRVEYFRLEKLKEFGVNAVRTAHNPPAPELLDAADQIGMLIMDENRRLGYDAETLGELERLIRRDRNHPSVFVWSLANEETLQGTSTGAKILSKMQDLVHQLDPSRQCTAAMNGGWGSGFSTVVDVQGFNYHEGNMRSFHTKFPDQPSVSTEDGSGFETRGIYASSAADGWIDDYVDKKASWGAVPETMVPFYSANPWNAGSFYWTGFDYRGEPTPYSWPAISSQFGLLDSCGFRKNGSYYLEANWTNHTVLHLFPHWNWSGHEGTPINVRVFSNCGDHVEVFLNGESQGLQVANTLGHEEWTVPYVAGTVEARCYSGDQVTATTTVTTTGDPAAISLEPDRAIIHADGKDVAMVTVAVIDANGATVPTANNLITFSVTGGKIIGVGNGDPGSHESDKGLSRSVFNGLAQVIVQATDKPGNIILRATSANLSSRTVTIKAR